MAHQTTLNELATGMATSISTVCANRMMISVRRRYYGHEHDLDDSTLASVNFADMHMAFYNGQKRGLEDASYNSTLVDIEIEN